jgi:hypothetical protein
MGHPGTAGLRSLVQTVCPYVGGCAAVGGGVLGDAASSAGGGCMVAGGGASGAPASSSLSLSSSPQDVSTWTGGAGAAGSRTG